MDNVPFSERAEFFTYQSASVAFDMVKDVCDFLLHTALPHTARMHDPLVTSIYVHYGRPFKQRKPLRLSDDIVPPDFQLTHKFLITLRDKMFAHTDLDGPLFATGALRGKSGSWSPQNELGGHTKNGSTKFGITVVTPDLAKVRKLCGSLIAQTDSRAQAIWKRHIGKNRVPDGPSVVNLSAKDGPFLIPHPYLAKPTNS